MTKRRSRRSWLPSLVIALGLFVIVWWTTTIGLLSMYWYQVIQIAAVTAISALGLNLIYGFNGQFSLGHVGFYAIGAYVAALISKDYMAKWSGSQVGGLAWIIAGQLGVLATLFAAKLLRIGPVIKRMRGFLKDQLKPYECRILTMLVALVMVAVTLAVGVAVAYLVHLLVYAVANAILPALPKGLGQTIVFLLALINGGTMAALASYLVGMPLLRLGSDYFGIATLGFAIMVYTALQNSDTVIATMKGARGMVGIPRWTTWGWAFGVLVVCIVILRNLVYSSHGRAIMSVREDEIAAQTMGIDSTQIKTLAFSFGGFFAGLAGGLYAHLYGFLHPSSFSFVKGFDPLIIIVFGGLGSMTGTLVASLAFALIIEGLRVVLPQGFEDWRFVVYPIILLLIMLLRQQGLLGTSEWGWLRAPLPPERDIPAPARADAVGVGEDA